MKVQRIVPRAAARRTVRSVIAFSALLATALAAVAGPAVAQAAPAASAFGAEVAVTGEPLVGPEPVASVPAPTGDVEETLVDLPAPPVAVNGTLTAVANVHATADITTRLTVVEQTLAGPYQARALGEVENLGLVFDVAGQGVPLLSAAAVRAEAVAVCGATPTFAANSEIIDLAIAGTAVPLNAPVQDLIDAISGVLTTSGLNVVVDVQRNVITPIAGGGIAVDALVVTILSAAGDAPLAKIRIAHAELTAAACPPPPQCSDGADNDADGVVDSADPGCHTDGNAANPTSYNPADNDETNVPQCSDGGDNDGDGVADTADPGCHTDGDPSNAASFDPADDDERNAQCSDRADNDGDGVSDSADPGCHTDGDPRNASSYDPTDNNETNDAARVAELPRTGPASTGGIGGLTLLALGLGALAFRRRFAATV